MKKLTGLCVALALIGGVAVLIGQAQERTAAPAEKKETPKPDKAAVKELMHKKLEHSQQLLAALVMNDLKKAAKHAEDLQRIRKEAAWMILKTKDYEMWSNEFATSADRIVKAAAEKNPDAAQLAYLEMSLTCFRCHTYVRDLSDIHYEGNLK